MSKRRRTRRPPACHPFEPLWREATRSAVLALATTGGPAAVAFPPVNQPWTLEQPVTFYESGGSAEQGSPVVGTLEGFNAIVNQSA
ncbi:hypothetical protein [Streptomyces sp. V1I6]|uniref:hypothetical protein n=1 Tax=Streptomyces sp. V1I6 TaxID=3042273 RepID=UPI002789D85C|nr:hypothetical protein [Streptomyces sp. V1I6]MDQ0847992.1 hypothetical protein [Streptomyces sp. V1I6]